MPKVSFFFIIFILFFLRKCPGCGGFFFPIRKELASFGKIFKFFGKKCTFFEKKSIFFIAIQKNSIIFASSKKGKQVMKYTELERLLRKIGCKPTGGEINGHPEWYSPVTDKYFPMSHHQHQEVASGTLRKIKRDSGLK